MANKNNVEIWLVRHGQTHSNLQGIISGWADVQLTDLGREQAQILRPFLSENLFESVWSSDLVRAIETARLAYGEPTIDQRLREIHFGELDGKSFHDLSKAQQDSLIAFFDFKAPKGESLLELTNRVHEFFDGLAPGRHLVFTHGGVVRAVTSKLGPDHFLPNGSVVGLNWSDKKLLFIRENEKSQASPLALATGGEK